MVYERFQTDEVNVLVSDASWAWPAALRQIFAPRGVNMLVARDASEFADVLGCRRIHAAIVDGERNRDSGLVTVRIMRAGYPRVPCILLT